MGFVTDIMRATPADLAAESRQDLIDRSIAMLKEIGIKPGALVRRRRDGAVFEVDLFEFGAPMRWQGRVLDNVRICGVRQSPEQRFRCWQMIGYAEDVSVVGREDED